MKIISFAAAIIALVIGSFGYGLVVVGQGIVAAARGVDRKVNRFVAASEHV